MYRAASSGFINATDCADYLVGKGAPFRDAYTITGKLVSYCIANGKTLETLSLQEYTGYSALFGSDVFEAISLEACVKRRSVPGGPAPDSVRTQIQSARQFLKDRNDPA